MKTLAGGAERGYASLNFSQSGGKLASVAIAPDYYLTVWDWELERIGLHSKAFGQDVFTINFSLDDERRLTSCGVGHIRFWKMAATFTGLKLQGFIGKFGKVELSDIVAFKELPDGKVLSGTEVGALLLWEGNFIKCRFTAVGGTLCHQGEITYVDYDRADNIVITCGKDGYVRFWDFEAIDAAEVDADISMDFELFPVAEYRLCEEGVGIHTMLDSGNQNGIRYLVVLDTFGRLVVHNVDVGKAHMFIDDDKETDEGKEGENKDGSEQEDSLPKVSKLYSIVHHFNHQGSFVYSAVTHKHMITSSTIGQFHYGKINAMDVSPCSYLAATVGQDGSVRCWNYASREMLGVVFNDKPATSVQWLPPLLDPTSRSFAVGFQDGVVRVYTLIGNSAVAEGVDVNDLDEAGHPIVKTVLCRKMVFKPHNGAILDMHFSIDGSKLATSGGDGIVFFFRCAGVDQNDPWVPLRFVTVARLYSNMDFDGTVLQIQTESEEAKRCRTMELNANNCLTCTHLNWQMNATLCNKILFSCSDGIIRELDATPLFTTVEDSDVQHAEAEGGILDEHHHADPLHDLSLETFEYFDIPCRVAEFILPLSEVQNQLTIANSLAALNNTTKEVVVETKEKKEEGDKEEGTVVAAKKESAPPAPKIISTRVNFCNYQYHSAAENKGDIYVSGTVTVNMNMTPKDTPITLPFVANYSWSDASCDHVTCYRSGVYTWDGKEALRQPVITNIQYSKAKHFMCMGASDGSMSLRPSSYPETFIRIQGHTGSVTGTGFSFDENFCLSAGADGGLMIYRVQRHEILKTCEGLGKDIAAGVYPVSVIYKDTTVTQLKEEEVEYQKYVIASAKADDNLAHEHGFDSIDCYVSTASEKPTSVDFSQVEDLHSQKAGVFDTPVPVEGNVTSEKVNADEPSTEVAVVEEKTGEESKDGKPSVEENEISSEMAMKPVQTSVATVTASRVSPIKAILMGVGEVEDIAENAYSIQDAKLKLEEDARRLEAEEKKNKIRAQVRQLQEDFEFIISQNNEMPESVRVPPEKLVVDHAFIRMLETEGENMVEEVHKECAYETEKAEALRRKLMHRLMNGLLVEEMPLYGFDKQSQNVVYSIRTRGTDSELREILNSVHAQVRAEELEEAKSKATTAAQRNASAAMNEMYGRMQKKEEAKSSEIISSGAGAGTSASARRELRRIRKAKLAEHASKRPNENEDDVRDVKAIEEAERTIGNYKLKCADDYEVPENQRTNVEKKRKQMAMLEESMVSMRLRFNERFLAMRELKRQMVATICRDNERVREINEELVASRALRLDSSTSGRLTPQRGVPNDAVDDRSSSSPLTQQPSEVSEWVKDPVEDPFLSPSEFKDDRDEVCAEELNEFKTRREKATWVDVYPPHNHVFTGAKTSIVTNYHTGRYVAEQKNVENIEFSNSLSQPEDYFPVVPEEPKPYGVNDTVLNSFSALQDVHTMKQMSKLDSFVPVLSIARRAKKSLLQKPNTKALNDSKMRRRRMLLFERKMLEKKTKDNIRGFEEALDELRIDRHTIAADLKLAELKLLVLYQEYKLLETFEAKDTTLQQKQQRCLKEKAEILASTTESQGKLQAKQEEFKQWDDKVAMVVSEFKQHVPESHAYCEILTKIFRKKVKRSKKTGDDDDDEFEEEEEVSNCLGVVLMLQCFIASHPTLFV